MKIIGHRGARGEAPENTIGGFRLALDEGVRHFELDLHLSADGVPIIIHDASATRTTGRRAHIAQTTAAQLTQFNAAANHKWPLFEPVPTLQSALPLLEECDSVQLEIKVTRAGDLLQLFGAMGELLAGCDPGRYSITSFNRTSLQLAQTLLPGLRRGLVCKRRFVDNIGLAKQLNCQLLVFHYRLLSPKLIFQAQHEGFEVSTYTTNSLADMEKLRDWNIDSAITDFPVRYRHIGEQNGYRQLKQPVTALSAATGNA